MKTEQKLETSGKSAHAIDVVDLKKYYKGKGAVPEVKAVDGVSFHVEEGEFFGLLGTNGAGKTTIISILTGILRSTGGEAFIGGYNVEKEIAKFKELISVCPQENAVHKFLSGQGNINFFANMYLMSKKEIREKSEELLKKLGLYEVRKRLAKGYSGGMLRQLSLIIALINDPQIMLLDEPTVGMDPRNRRKVWEFLNEIKSTDKTVILTTHYIEEAEALCDRVAIIDYGQIMEIGVPQELMKKYEVDSLEDVFMKVTGRKITEGL